MSLIDLFRKNKQDFSQQKNTFSGFVSSSSADKKKILKTIVRKANEEQRKVVESFRKASMRP